VAKFVDDFCSYSFDSFVGHHSSEYLKENRDRRIAYELERYYQMTKQILAENRAFLDALVDELMEKRTLTCRDVERIKKVILTAA
jgi:cell division protease FtsH